MRTAYAGGRDRTLASVYYRFPKLISNSRGTSGTGAMSAVAVPTGGSYPENRLVDRKRGERGTRASSGRPEVIVRTGTIECSVTREENANARVRQTASVGASRGARNEERGKRPRVRPASSEQKFG
ncbi:unnamed protein product [Lasius platythorax]|uniref:Uncharacterized protein n=1 Tax=Lasius platythorax TaxID=488582 RepID=A0AAV2NBA1_9HYME